MTGLPQKIPEIGSVDLELRPDPNFVPDSQMTTEDYFLLSRCDGVTSIKDIILMSGFNVDKCVEIFLKLRRAGALLVGDESAQESKPISKGEENKATKLEHPTAEEMLALNEACDLSESEKIRILSFGRRLESGTHYELLGVAPGASKSDIRKTYFKYSKEFHPDKKFGSKLGSFEKHLNDIFSSLNRAYQDLSTKKKRARYDASIGLHGNGGLQGQSKEDHALSLYEQACNVELQGQFDEAIKLFKASLKLKNDSRRSKRAALCSIRAGDLVTAKNFADGARALTPNDPAVLRVLADIASAKEEWQLAKDLLVQALDIRTENDSLVTEIQSDIALVETKLKSTSEG